MLIPNLQSDVPERWRAKALSQVDPSSIDKVWTLLFFVQTYQILIRFFFQRHSLPGCYYRDSDFCFLDDNTGKFPFLFFLSIRVYCHPEGDYFDLTLVPERYTGYSGKDAHRVWRSIYEENCFGLSELNLMSGKAPAAVSLADTMNHDDGHDSDSHCLEKRVYYKVISGAVILVTRQVLLLIGLTGLHASISTHICLDYLNQSTGEWVRR